MDSIRITLTHWTGSIITIDGEFTTTMMGRKGPLNVIENLEELGAELSGQHWLVEIEEVKDAKLHDIP